MTITQTVREHRALFSKQRNIITIKEVLPTDAKELHTKIRLLFSEYGYDSHYEVYVTGAAVNNVAIRGDDSFQSLKDVNHFLRGFELAMSLSGVDVTCG